MELKFGKQKNQMFFKDVPIGSLFETQGGYFIKTVHNDGSECAMFIGCANKEDEKDFCVIVGEITGFDDNFVIDNLITNAKIVW